MLNVGGTGGGDRGCLRRAVAGLVNKGEAVKRRRLRSFPEYPGSRLFFFFF